MKLEDWASVKVGGRAVTDAGKAETPLSGRGPGGGARHYLKTGSLLLDDGTTAYGCLWDGCDFTSDHPTSIVTGHWKVHEIKPDLKRVPYGDWTLTQILGRLTDVEAEVSAAVAARDRALEAHQGSREVIADLRAEVKRLERELAAIRSTFKSLAAL